MAMIHLYQCNSINKQWSLDFDVANDVYFAIPDIEKPATDTQKYW